MIISAGAARRGIVRLLSIKKWATSLQRFRRARPPAAVEHQRHEPEIKSKGQIKEHQSQFVRVHFCSRR
jgi:hypothetical protein